MNKADLVEEDRANAIFIGRIFLNILKALFLWVLLCICMCGMDVLDGEGFGGRFTPSTNNTTYLGLFYVFNASYLVQFR